MECTGERYLPEFDRDWTLEHLHRYLLACELAAGKTVLDIACGDGYGSIHRRWNARAANMLRTICAFCKAVPQTCHWKTTAWTWSSALKPLSI